MLRLCAVRVVTLSHGFTGARRPRRSSSGSGSSSRLVRRPSLLVLSPSSLVPRPSQRRKRPRPVLTNACGAALPQVWRTSFLVWQRYSVLQKSQRQDEPLPCFDETIDVRPPLRHGAYPRRMHRSSMHRAWIIVAWSLTVGLGMHSTCIRYTSLCLRAAPSCTLRRLSTRPPCSHKRGGVVSGCTAELREGELLPGLGRLHARVHAHGRHPQARRDPLRPGAAWPTP